MRELQSDESKQLLLSVFGVVIIIIAVVGVTYAIFRYTSNAEQKNSISTGAIEMSYIESSTNVITINNALPTSDIVGMKQGEYFDFTIKATVAGSLAINYQLWARQIPTENSIDKNGIKIYLEKELSGDYQKVVNPIIFNPTGDKGMLIYSSVFNNENNGVKNFSDNYRFRMWLDEKYQLEKVSKTFKLKIDVYAVS